MNFVREVGHVSHERGILFRCIRVGANHEHCVVQEGICFWLSQDVLEPIIDAMLLYDRGDRSV